MNTNRNIASCKLHCCHMFSILFTGCDWYTLVTYILIHTNTHLRLVFVIVSVTLAVTLLITEKTAIVTVT